MNETPNEEFDRLHDEMYEHRATGGDTDDPAYQAKSRRVDELREELGIVEDPGDPED